jgi:hypothetical protein
MRGRYITRGSGGAYVPGRRGLARPALRAAERFTPRLQQRQQLLRGKSYVAQTAWSL